MKILRTREKVYENLKQNKNLSFVPTMGSLHNGHISLIQKAKKRKGNVIVSIFVNPKQFNSKKDFDKYPRNLKKDIRLLKRLKIDYLFIPTYNQIFSFKAKNKIFLHNFSKKLCGKYRPGHFLGVLDVVNRFIEIIKPNYLFLGRKDFQQLFLISEHIKKNNINTKIVSCKTIREKNGIAISSRNLFLTKNEKKILMRSIDFLKKNKKKINGKNIRLFTKKLKFFGIEKIEYLKIVDLNSVKFKANIKKNCNIFIAFYLNKIRLIDNF